MSSRRKPDPPIGQATQNRGRDKQCSPACNRFSQEPRGFRRLHQLRSPQIVQMNDAQQSVLFVDDHERGNSFFFHDSNG
jgi:hypothetical protein